MEKILNLQRGWKSRLWFGEKAFALCFVIFTAFTGLVSVNAGPGALYESHTFRTILNVMLTAAAYVIAIDLVYNMMFNFSQRFYQSIVIEEAIAIIPFIVGLIILYVFSCGKTVADLMYFKTYEHLWVTFVIAACMIIQERIIERYIRLMAWEEIEKISTLNFHVRMRECDLLKLYQYYIFDRSRQRLIVNAKPYDNDQLYVNILGNRINLNDILIGDHYKWNPEKFPKIYDGSFKDFLESFDFEANGICRVHDSIYASDENDILIGRKMKSVIDKLF